MLRAHIPLPKASPGFWTALYDNAIYEECIFFVVSLMKIYGLKLARSKGSNL